MYVKFLRSYFEDKKEKPDEAELSVELQGEKGKQDEGKTGLYRLLCFILAVICLILLVVAVVLGVKLQTESTLCQRNDRFNDRQSPPTCSLENCQNSFPKMAFKKLPCRQCASGWLTFGTSCFFLSTTRLTWFESQKNCSSGGGSLAIVTNQTVQNFLTRKGNLKYWIGLRHEVSSWNWVNNNKLQQSYWTESVQNGDCAYLNGDGPAEKNWDRAPCRASTYFICQLQF
ncbi:C-type lectin domain family 4 member E isoform X2 [Poeciliopsis prolifica]|uniref:C-type lectin domain family 4 member E isoform X2 n=1 Tax=Poeciliopsis prolifica TaxID=188132 RepID=UPI002412FB44|nr:C-type lectin domain family 4 member E isoform X2 [Poeciliopsis prolifica]